MTVMTLAAAAVGAIYKEITDEHRRDGTCPCGWQPIPRADVEALQAALAHREGNALTLSDDIAEPVQVVLDLPPDMGRKLRGVLQHVFIDAELILDLLRERRDLIVDLLG